MDEPGHPGRQQRVADEGLGEGRVAELLPLAREHGTETALAVLPDVDSGVDALAGLREEEAVLLRELEERRHVQPLLVRIRQRARRIEPLLGRKQVREHLAERVRDLGDHAREGSIRAVAVVEADRVEHIAEHAQVGQQEDPAAAQVDLVLSEEPEDVLPDREPRVAEVVAPPKGEDVRAVDREERQAAVELGQLVEVEQSEVDAVAEDVLTGLAPRVDERSGVEPRPHQRAPNARAAARPETRPSSWKPKPW